MEESNNTSVNELAVLLDLSQTEKDLAETEQAMANVVHDVKTKTGMKAAKADVSKLRGMRTTVDKVRLEAGRVLLSLKKVNDDKAKVLIERIVKLEQPLKDQIDAYEAEQEAIRLAALQAEQDRIDGHRARIAAWRNLPGDLVGRPLAGIRVALNRLQAEAPATFEEMEEFAQEGYDAYLASVGRVTQMVADGEASEAERERQRQRDEEFQQQQEALRVAQERAAQLEREAEERRQADLRREREEQERAEREDRERQEAADREAEHQRRMILSEIEGIRQQAIIAVMGRGGQRKGGTLECFEQTLAETEAWPIDDHFGLFVDMAQDAKADAIAEIKHEMNAFIARQRENERLQKEREEADARAAEAERARREQALQAEEERQQSLTMRKAAQALVDLCVSRGMGHEREVEDLNAMLLVTEGDLVPVKRQPRKPVKVTR